MALTPRDIAILRLQPAFILADIDSGLIVSVENAIRSPDNNITIDHGEGIVLQVDSRQVTF